MQRPIEFKIWDSQSKEFIPSFIASTIFAIICSGPEEGESFCCDSESYKGGRYIPQQFTGLTDKNGKKIFEGDILVYRPDYTESLGGQRGNLFSLVVFEDGAFMFGDEISNQEWAQEHEIVGNIFENPELIS